MMDTLKKIREALESIALMDGFDAAFWPASDTAREALALLDGMVEGGVDRQPIGTAPKNGTPIIVGHMVRYLPYKPDGKRQMGVDGRWQEWNGYGWSNIDWEPEGFWESAEPRHQSGGDA